jgi:hypothetical protein
VRKVQSTLRDSGAENVAVIVQGRLAGDDSIEGAGLVTQIKKEGAPASPPPQHPQPPLMSGPRRE